MTLVELQLVSAWAQGRPVVQDISFVQQHAEKLAICGATGSGKSTLLRAIAGLHTISSGVIYFDGLRVPGPNERLLPGHPSIAYLSQQYELRHHYRVEEILEKAATVPDAEAKLIYEVCRITHLQKRVSHQLSGGEAQRVALARLLVGSPKLLLLDEPFSNLDPIHKSVMKEVIEEVSGRLGITCLLVSHDPQDTLAWADSLLVMQDGKAVQQGAPRQLYNHPKSEYVAALFGGYNVVDAALAAAFKLRTSGEATTGFSIIRPHRFRYNTAGDGVEAVVAGVLFKGAFDEVRVMVNDRPLTMTTPPGALKTGSSVYIKLTPPEVE